MHGRTAFDEDAADVAPAQQSQQRIHLDVVVMPIDDGDVTSCLSQPRQAFGIGALGRGDERGPFRRGKHPSLRRHAQGAVQDHAER